MTIPKANESFHIDDNATATDQLNRFGFSQALAGLIINAPEASSFRLGIYGGWGEGKSSVLSMMQKTLEESSVVCVPFIPWVSKTTEEMLDDLLFAIVDVLGLKVGEKIKQQEKGHKNAHAINDIFALGKEYNPLIKAASAAIDKAVEFSHSRLHEWKGKALLDSVKSRLIDQKVTVFVDDLDRVKPELLPDLLLNLRSILDLPNLFYVLALSPQIVQEGLEKIHPGWDDPLKFLEKIVEYPILLPKPTEDEMRQFTRLNIEALNDVVDTQALDSLGYLLPRNPRQVKLFLRYLASLQGQLQRFRPDEISLYTLYLCQLIRMEFSNEVQSILEDVKTLQDISSNLYDSIYMTNGEKGSVNERPEAKYAPNDEDGKERFVSLFTALRNVSYSLSQYTLRDLFLLLERPPILTWKEFDALHEGFERTTDDQKARTISEWLETNGAPTPIRASALFAKAIGSRENSLSYLADLNTRKEMQEALPMVNGTATFLRFLISDLGLIRDGLVLSSVWNDLFKHLRQYSKWSHPKELYASLRDVEIELFRLSTDRMPEDMQESVYLAIRNVASIHTEAYPFFDPVSPKFQRAAAEVVKIIGCQIAERMLSRFEEPDGLIPIWRLDTHHTQMQMLFDPASPFHSSNFHARTKLLAKQAGQNETIQKNFLQYFHMLGAGTLLTWRSFPREGIHLLQDSHYLKIIWSAAVAHTLNPRHFGTIRRIRNDLILQQNIKETTLPTPRWWQKMNNEFPVQPE